MWNITLISLQSQVYHRYIKWTKRQHSTLWLKKMENLNSLFPTIGWTESYITVFPTIIGSTPDSSWCQYSVVDVLGLIGKKKKQMNLDACELAKLKWCRWQFLICQELCNQLERPFRCESWNFMTRTSNAYKHKPIIHNCPTTDLFHYNSPKNMLVF